MKRRLNFSMMNRPIKDREIINKNKNYSIEYKRKISLNEEQLKK